MSSPRPSSPIPRGRSASPITIGVTPPRGRQLPSYVRPSQDRSPNMNPLSLDDRLSVPPPIYLRSSSPQSQSSKGTCKLHIPAWGIVLVRPPQRLELHPLDTGTREPPTEDTVLTGALEVIMKERRRCQAISVGVQSVSRLHMGRQRGWEEDGVFERGVEVMGGDAEGIWLEKGSQSFTFSILLPATLATHDFHQFGRISYILTARVEGIPSSSISQIFRKDPTAIRSEIPFKEDFDAVIARSDKLAQDQVMHRKDFSKGSFSSSLAPLTRPSPTSRESQGDDFAIAFGEGSPTFSGLYHRSQSTDIQNIPPLNLGSSPPADDQRSIHSLRSSSGDASASARTEKNGWLKGDLSTSRSLIIHANPSQSGGVSNLDLRKGGFVAGLGAWRFSATSDVFSISGVIFLSVAFPCPSPSTTIFFGRLLLAQTYTLISPRTPNNAPHQPDATKTHLLYQVGVRHKPGDRFLGHEAEALWRGSEAGGSMCESEGEGWRTRAVARLPNHEKLRPSTNDGTITPIRVTHEMQLQIFYSVEGETVAGAPIKGPGELRMMQVKMPLIVPSCCCSPSALNLPIYEPAKECPQINIDEILNSPPAKQSCMCGNTFAELGEAAMRRMQTVEVDDEEGLTRVNTGGSTPRSGTPGEKEGRRSSGAGSGSS